MDSAPVLDLLILARAFVEAGWARGEWALDRDGEKVLVHEDAAVRFCVAGALRRAGWELAVSRRTQGVAEDLLGDVLHSDRLGDFNDDPATTQADVLALFDQACERVVGK